MANGGLMMEEINKKLIFFGYDEVAMFIGVHIGVATQITRKVAPFMFVVHCVAHKTT
jgi:hypothetical protein